LGSASDGKHLLSHRALTDRIIESLEAQGFTRDGNVLLPPKFEDKSGMRQKHTAAVELARAKAEPRLRRHEDALLRRFASGDEVDVNRFAPRLVEVSPDSADELLFRYARHHWSIPTSAGYGRRLRFLVLDKSNQKLVGLIGLGDPVFALGARDKWIGWTREECSTGLHNVMDAFVLGAVPPYSYLIGSKLIALLVASDQVRLTFQRKYGTSVSRINRRELHSRPS
jgi:hypothetical protein